MSAGSSIDDWFIVAVPGLSQDIWTRTNALHISRPPATALKKGIVEEAPPRYDASDFEKETWPDFARGETTLALRTLSAEVIKQMNAIIKASPKFKGQSEQISTDFGLSLDTAFPDDLKNDDQRLGALRRVTQALPIDRSIVLWNKPGTLQKLKLILMRLKVYHTMNSQQ